MQSARQLLSQYLHSWFHCIKQNVLLTLVIGVAFLLYMLVIMPSGSTYCIKGECGLYFWGAHEHDGIWHIALIEAAFKTWPFNLPIYAGEQLKNYNYLFDFVLFLLTKTGISSWTWYFKIQPVVWFIVFVFCSRRFIRTVKEYFGRTKAASISIWVYTSVFFSSSFGHFFTLYWDKSIKGSSGLLAMQGEVGMTNPQFMWSLVGLLYLLDIFTSYYFRKQNLTAKRLFSIGLTLLILSGLKLYSAFIGCIMLLALSSVLIARRQYRSSLILAICTLLALASAYLLFYRQTGSTSGFILQPFALVKEVFADRRLFYSPQIIEEWSVLLPNSKRLLWYQLQATGIYLFTSFGIRNISILFFTWWMIQKLRRKNTSRFYDYICVLVIIALVCVTPGILLIQKGIWWNTVQFIYYGIFVLSISSGLVLGSMSYTLHRRVTFVAFMIFVLMALPTHIDAYYQFSSPTSSSFIPANEYSALTLLGKLPAGVVFTQPLFKKNTDDYANGAKYDKSSIPLPDLADTAYVTAISGKTQYISDQTQLELLNIPNNQRFDEWTNQKCSALQHVQYVYLRSRHRMQDLKNCSQFKLFGLIFANPDAEIWAKNQ